MHGLYCSQTHHTLCRITVQHKCLLYHKAFVHAMQNCMVHCSTHNGKQCIGDRVVFFLNAGLFVDVWIKYRRIEVGAQHVDHNYSDVGLSTAIKHPILEGVRLQQETVSCQCHLYFLLNNQHT